MVSFLRIVVSVLAVAVLLNVERSEATNYTVGDSTGWTNMLPNSEFYDNWETNKVFRVGDNLIFNWTGNHDVVSVSETQYDQCTLVTTGVFNTSPAIVALTEVREYHFICTIGAHCRMGQKLSIDVLAATTPSPSGSFAPSVGPMVALSAAFSMLTFFL